MRFKQEILVEAFINKEKLITTNENILLAISGGADSLCLLHILNQLQNELPSNLFVAHINHNLRGDDANKDEIFVKNLAAHYNLPFESRSLDVKGFAKDNKLSIETAARILRQKHLAQIAQQFNCSKIATAHHMNDNAETLIHRMLRGSGYRGLGGISPCKDFKKPKITYIRPILCLKRNEIEDYLNKIHITWRNDHTNNETIYTRNKIRHLILPELQRQNSSDLIEALFSLSGKCRKLEDFIKNQFKNIVFESISSNKIIINRKDFNNLSQPVKIALIQQILTEIDFPQLRLNKTHIRNIIELAEKETGTHFLELPCRFAAINEYDNLIFKKQNTENDTQNQNLAVKQLSVNSSIMFDNFKLSTKTFEFHQKNFKKFLETKDNCIEWFDFDKIQGEISIRYRKEGDRFVPMGLKTAKKIGKFLTNEKISREIRKKTLIIEDAKKVIWLCPVRSSNETAVNRATKRVLQIEALPID